MAAWLLLRRGPPRVLKTMLLEAQVFRGLTSTASLSESVKNGTGLPSSSKKQSPSKNVVQAKERGQPLSSRPAAVLAANLSPPGSPPTGGSKSQVAPSARLGGNMQLTDEGPRRPLSRKTLVEFPQKVLPRFPERGSDSNSPSSSSSSSSSSSDSESDEEGLGSEAAPQVVSKGKKGFPKPEASRSSKNRAPKISGSAKEGAKAQRPQTDVPYPEPPLQPRKKGPAMPAPEADKEARKQSLKKEQLQKGFGLNETEKASQKPRQVKEASPGQTRGRFPAFPAGLSPEPPSPTREARPRGQPPATVAGAQGRHLDPKDTGPGREAPPPLAREESVGTPATGLWEAKKTGGAGVPPGSAEAVPVREEVFIEETAAPKLKGGPQEMAGAAPPTEDAAQDPGQAEPAQAPAPPEPFDNTTYRNLQHHDYNAYTFLDVNLDLSRFRLPQPSSGRESPRH